MAFCTNCGAAVSGQFCPNCGSPVKPGSEATGPAPAPRKKRSPLLWILAIAGGLFAVIALVLMAGGVFLYHKARQAGFDPELMSRDPAVGIAKLLAATHPDLELVSVNEASKRVTLRRKSSGKYITLDLRDMQEGKVLLDAEEDGRVVVGGEVNLPEWVPNYPNSKAEASITGENRQGEGGMFHFTSPDSASQILDFYERELKDAGFEIEVRAANTSGSGGAILNAKDAQRRVTVMLDREGASTRVVVTYADK
jgi:hypothetical protein